MNQKNNSEKRLWSERLEELYLQTHNKPEIVAILDEEKNRLYFPNCPNGVPSRSSLYNITKKYIYRHLDETNKQFQGYIKHGDNKNISNKKSSGNVKKAIPELGTIVTSSYGKKGDSEETFSGKILLAKGEKLTEEMVLDAYNLDKDKWYVTYLTINSWEMMNKDGDPCEMWQFKLTVKPKSPEIVDVFEAYDKYFATKEFAQEREPLKPFKVNTSGQLLEIDYTDAHIGLYSDADQAGNDFNIMIAKEMFEAAIADVIMKAQGRKFEKIRFITIGDILHTDNSKGTTTSGTPQDTDCMFGESIKIATDMLVEGIEELLSLQVPIEYVYVQGNHDRDIGYALANAVRLAFRDEPNLEVDISRNPHKVKTWGNSVIGYTHGDINKKNNREWMARMYPRQYSEAKYREIHCGHLHSEATTNINGILIKRLPSLCESSAWEHQSGYCSQSALFCSVWTKDRGLSENWIFNF